MIRTIGSLCTGYGGLEMAISVATGQPHPVLFHAEKGDGPAAVLAHRYPDVPNLEDIEKAAWKEQPHVDLLLAGFPCQGNSAAGKRLGRADERWLWPAVFEAILALQPPEVVIENVSNLLNIDRGHAFGDVLADLARAGYAVRWTTVGACAVGLSHHRHRVFVRAWRGPARRPDWTRDRTPHAYLLLGGWPDVIKWPAAGRMHAGVVWAEQAPRCGAPRTGGRLLLPTPLTRDGDPKQRGEGSADYWRRRLLAGRTNGMPLGAAVKLLPTTRAADAAKGIGPTARPGKVGVDLPTVAGLLPTPRASDGAKGGPGQRGSKGDLALPSAVVALLPTPRASDVGTAGRRGSQGWRPPLSQVIVREPERFGGYAQAIELHTQVTGAQPPDPTEPNGRGDLRLSPAFAEWMMALPAGHVTDVLDRVPALQAVGNGVVPLQGAVAYVLLGGK